MVAIFICSAGCGGVLKENRGEKVDDSVVSSKNEYGFGARLSEDPFIVPSGINITLAKDDTVKIEIITSEGDSTAIYIERFLELGENFVHLNADNLASGIYNIKITNSDTTITKGMAILR